MQVQVLLSARRGKLREPYGEASRKGELREPSYKFMIGIIGALDSEVNSLIADLSDITTKDISGIKFFSGHYNDKEIVIAKSGVGKVFAAMCAEAMILNFNVDKIIHIGIAGLLDETIDINGVAIASSVVQHDMDSTALGDPPGKILETDLTYFPCSKKLIEEFSKVADSIGIKYKIGIIASGDQFVADEKTKKRIVDTFSAIACEMEGAATGQVSFVNGIDFIVIRAFSDSAGDESKNDYWNEKYNASDRATSLIKAYLSA